MLGSRLLIFTLAKQIFLKYNVPNFHSHTSYDEIERIISTHNPSETIIISNNFKSSEIEDIIQFCTIQSKAIHKISLEDKTQLAAAANKCENKNIRKNY